MNVNDLIMQRQSTLNLEIPKVVTVIGVGGTGFWTSIISAMSGVEHIILVDNDIVETSNLNRLPIQKSVVGCTKVYACKNFIYNMRPKCIIEGHEIKIYNSNIGDILRGDVVFCCTDNLKSQRLIKAYCDNNNIRYRRVGYDGTILNVSTSMPLSFYDNEDDAGYTITPSWVVPAIVSAGLAVASEFYPKMDDFAFTSDIAEITASDSTFVPMMKLINYISKDKNSDITKYVISKLMEDDIIIRTVMDNLSNNSEIRSDAIERLIDNDNDLRSDAISRLIDNNEDLRNEAIEQLKDDRDVIDDAISELKNSDDIIERAKNELKEELQNKNQLNLNIGVLK